MKCCNIIDSLEARIPSQKAYSWDNVGLLAGRDDKEIKSVLIALDATDEVVELAIQDGVDLLITHHPLIFSPLKKVNNQDFISRRILKLIQHDISYYVLHTNYDIVRMADLASRKLGLINQMPMEVTDLATSEGLGKVGEFPKEITLKQSVEQLKEGFFLPEVKVYGDLGKKIKKVAILPGSGKGEISLAIKHGADVYITGDIGYHDGMDANLQGLAVLDAGHYGLEHIFIADIENIMQQIADDLIVRTMKIEHLYTTV